MTTVWLVIRSDGGCGDPECCGTSYDTYEVYSNEELARVRSDRFDRVEELTLDEGIV